MDDSIYPDLLQTKHDMNIIKQEVNSIPSVPLDIGPSSASVPIPKSYRNSHTIDDHFSPSPLANPALWGSCQTGDLLIDSQFKVELQDSLEPQLSFKMDDDDIFQVDKADLIQGPTLAELNANEDTLLNDLNFDDLLLPNETVQTLHNIPTENFYTSYIHSSNISNFASSSLPQHIQSYHNLFKNTPNQTFSEAINVINPNQAIGPNTLSFPGTSIIAGI